MKSWHETTSFCQIATVTVKLAENMRQRTVVWLIYRQSEYQEEAILVNFPCASEIVSCQWFSVEPSRARHALSCRAVFIYATAHNSWETWELGCPSHNLLSCALYISCDHYFHIDHNAPRFRLRILLNHCFQIILGITVVPREIEHNGYAKFWGVYKVHYGLCEKGECFACPWTCDIPVDLCRTVTTVERPGTR